MTDEGAIAVEDRPRSTNLRGSAVEVRVPASAANLGAGFDCFGLALQLYLTVRVTVAPESFQPCRMRGLGEGYGTTPPLTADNLIFRAMNFAAEKQGLTLPPISIEAENEIPLGSGLGSSAAAIIAGLTAGVALCEREISNELILRYATELEGHSDNVAASLLGGLVVTCTVDDGSVIAVKKYWPRDIKVIVVSPHTTLETARARGALSPLVSHADAVHNLQRAALFTAALEERRYDLLWEATRDRLHQERRQTLVPGLEEALATSRRPGLLGLALSGAGPSVLALAQDHFDEVGMVIAECFHRQGIETTVRLLEVDDLGRQIKRL
ncbi:MAG: homoserine kinase [Blastocatellia bacterium]|jgi:homoserine kinase|nr:homoserine kinase [Blastocatellia bacterium]